MADTPEVMLLLSRQELATLYAMAKYFQDENDHATPKEVRPYAREVFRDWGVKPLDSPARDLLVKRLQSPFEPMFAVYHPESSSLLAGIFPTQADAEDMICEAGMEAQALCVVVPVGIERPPETPGGD